MIEGLKIVLLSVLSAVCYGILHDNVTTRVCIEYFTVFHRRVDFVGGTPTALAFYWGIVATWWMGVGLGVPLACFARWGQPPKVRVRDLIRPLGTLLLTMGICSAVMGILAYSMARGELIVPYEPWFSRIETTKHAAFLADLWAHNTAYTVGFIGGVSLWGWCVRFRNQAAKSEKDSLHQDHG